MSQVVIVLVNMIAMTIVIGGLQVRAVHAGSDPVMDSSQKTYHLNQRLASQTTMKK